MSYNRIKLKYRVPVFRLSDDIEYDTGRRNSHKENLIIGSENRKVFPCRLAQSTKSVHTPVEGEVWGAGRHIAHSSMSVSLLTARPSLTPNMHCLRILKQQYVDNLWPLEFGTGLVVFPA